MLGTMDCDGLTDVGRVREANQDQFLIADFNKSMTVHRTSLGLLDHSRMFGGSQGKLLLVADGVGGHANGQRASTLAVDSLVSYLLNTMPWFLRPDGEDEDLFLADLRVAVEHSEQDLKTEMEAIPERRDMGTTLTMAYVIWPRMYVVHVGDSRCYLFRDSKLTQITRDHTFGQELVDAGSLQPEEAASSRLGNVLSNVLGGDAEQVRPEVYKNELALGDTVLLCSDGLTKHVADEQIALHLARDLAAEQTCQQLVDKANDSGGTDNVTAVVARFRRTDEQADLAAEEVVVGEDTERANARSDAERGIAT